MAVGEQMGYGAAHLPRLDLRRRIAADDNAAGLAYRRHIVFVAACFIMADQPLGGMDDFGRGAVVAVQHMDLCAGMAGFELKNMADVGGPKRVKRLIVVAHGPELHAIRGEVPDECDLARVHVLIFVDKEMIAKARRPSSAIWAMP